MVTEEKYTFREFAQKMNERSESKPVIGKDVIRTDAENNTKAAEDIMKQTAEYNDVEQAERKTNPENEVDLNKSLLDLDYIYAPSQEYKDRVKAQVHGFPSVENEKNSDVRENDSLDYEGNEKFYDNRKKVADERGEAEAEYAHAGLKARELDKKYFEKKNALTNENRRTMKRLTFHGTTFLDEEDMTRRIPDDYRKDGNTFIMEDKEGTQYVVECKADTVIKSYIHTHVTGVYNQRQLHEQIDRMKELSGYKHSDMKCRLSAQGRLNEEDRTRVILESIRKAVNTEEK